MSFLMLNEVHLESAVYSLGLLCVYTFILVFGAHYHKKYHIQKH